MAHHGHLVERRLSVEEDEANQDEGEEGKGQLRMEEKVEERERDSLSVLEMSLDDPSVLKSTGVVLVVSQIDPLSRVSENVTSSWVVLRSLVDELLEVGDVVRSDCETKGETRSASFSNELERAEWKTYLVLGR